MGAAVGGLPKQRGNFNFSLNEAPIITLSSASILNVFPSDANTLAITGGGPAIVSLGVASSGAVRRFRFLGATTIAHNATSNILPTAANITTAANWTAQAISLGQGNWYWDYFTKADGTALAGGLQFWQEALATTGTNAGVNATSWQVKGGATDQSIIFLWKGNGFIAVQVPDGTTAGGNLRGPASLDMQVLRVNANEVASGTSSALIATLQSMASGPQSAAVAAQDGYAQGTRTLVTGRKALADSDDTFISGIYGASRGIPGSRVHGGEGNSTGENQFWENSIRRDCTFSITPVQMTTSGGGASTANIPVIPDNSMAHFTASSLLQAGTTNRLDRKFEGTISRGAGVATTTINVATMVTTTYEKTAGVATTTWGLTCTADTTNGGLNISFNGDAGQIVAGMSWVNMVQLTRM